MGDLAMLPTYTLPMVLTVLCLVYLMGMADGHRQRW
jgi:hypothetical protein